jgi:hypothetical protein
MKSYLEDSTNQEKIELFIDKAKNENAWFSDFLIRSALQAMNEEFLDVMAWDKFFKQNGLPVQQDVKNIGLILPGNLPAVGFHDLLMTVASGHRPLVKLSKQDTALMSLYIDLINQIDADIQVTVQDRISKVDAVIATGSDFSSEYFLNYFSKIQHIIRKNRSSVAVFTGQETDLDYKNFAKDIFMYFGLGCRNVSTLAVPEYLDLVPLFDVLTQETWVLDHTKYSNNYQYHKTLYLLNQIKHFDLGNLIVTESDSLVSPAAVLFVYRYKSQADLELWLASGSEKIQCIVGTNYIPFGKAQQPALDDFADGINTFQFLINLS